MRVIRHLLLPRAAYQTCSSLLPAELQDGSEATHHVDSSLLVILRLMSEGVLEFVRWEGSRGGYGRGMFTNSMLTKYATRFGLPARDEQGRAVVVGSAVSGKSLLFHQCGSSVVELALLTSLFVLLLAGSVTMGQACYVAIELSAAANAGAEYGTLHPTDAAGMQNAATLSAANLTGVSPAATYGCECMDGTSASTSCTTIPSCTTTIVRYVSVTTALTYKPVFMFPGIPSSLALKGSARMRATY